MTDLRIATPCHESWDGMSRQPHGRHCAACDQTVVDLGGLATEAFTPALQAVHERIAAGGCVCIRAPVDAQGRLQGRAPRRRRRLLLTNGLAGITAVALAGCQGSGPDVAMPAATTTTTQDTTASPSITPRALPAQVQPGLPSTSHDRLQQDDTSSNENSIGIAVITTAPSPQPPRRMGTWTMLLGECSSIPVTKPAEPPLPHERL